MECKIVVGTKEGKTYNIEAKDEHAKLFLGKRIGDTVNATPLGLKGYEVQITGGSDKCGFPMRRDAHISGRAKALLSSKTVGYRQKGSGVRRKKTVVGSTITEAASQINTTVVKAGKDPIEKLIGGAEEAAPTEGAGGEKPAEPKHEAKPEAAPAEEAPKHEAKPEAAPAEEAPKHEAKPEAAPAEEAKEAPKEAPSEAAPAEEAQAEEAKE